MIDWNGDVNVQRILHDALLALLTRQRHLPALFARHALHGRWRPRVTGDIARFLDCALCGGFSGGGRDRGGGRERVRFSGWEVGCCGCSKGHEC